MSNRPKGNAPLIAAQQQHVRELNTLHAATVALLNTIELGALLEQTLTVALQSLPAANRGMLLISDRSTGQMQVRAARGYTDPRLRPPSHLQPTGHLARALRERAPLLISNVQADHASPHPVDVPELRAAGSVVIAPLLLENDVLGALMLDAPRRHAFVDSDLRLLAAFAATASVAIRNAQLYEEVQRQAVTDSLTGLYNRRAFFELGQRELERARRFNHPLSLILFDVDHFKQVNETFGHAVGDQVIHSVAARSRRCLRHIDLLGRYGGEEFVVLLPETDMSKLYQVAERLRRCIADKPIETDRGPIPITVSLGVSVAGEDTFDLGSLLRRADGAMYAAKQMGGNYLVVR